MCGVLGLWANEAVFPHLYQGLLGIQHRGQDSAGIVTYDGRFHTKKGNGLVRDIFTEEHAKRLTGSIGIGHTRYPTIGGGRGEDAQPFQLNSPFGIIMAHNGNVVNYGELKKSLLEEHHRLLNSDNDVETILNVFAQELEAQRVGELTPEHVFKAVKGVYDRVVGSYSVVAYIAGQGMVAFRDPFGIKPLVWGVRKDGLKPTIAFASESVSLNIMGIDEITDVEAGQAIFVDRDRVHAQKDPGLQAPFALPVRVGLFRPAGLLHRRGQRLSSPGRARPAAGRRDQPPGAADRRGRAGARFGARRGHRDRPQAQPALPRSPGQEPLHRPDFHHARTRTTAGRASASSSTPSPPNSRARTSCSSTTASSAARRRGPSSIWSGIAGPRPSISPRPRRRCGIPACTASTCRPGPSSSPATAIWIRSPLFGRRPGHLPDADQSEEGRAVGERRIWSISAPPVSTANISRATSPRRCSRPSKTSARLCAKASSTSISTARKGARRSLRHLLNLGLICYV